VFITVFLITVIIATAVTFILPESFASTARIKVEPDMSDIKSGIPATPPVMPYDPHFIPTTMEIIQSQAVLEIVIERLNLNVEWGRKYLNGQTLKTSETFQILKARLTLAPVGGVQRIIAITVYSDNPSEAAQIANATAEAYQAYRIRSHAEMITKAIEALPPGPQKEAAQLEAQKPALTLLVQIVDKADPGRFPVKPNKPLNIALGAAAGIILGALAALVAGLFASRKK
jgi:uncharacterized protein involved in exopolysaccharide biosynthesis